MKTPTQRPLFLSAPLLALALVCGSPAHAQNEEDVSVEALYQKAGELSVAGQHEEASKTFERMFDLSGGVRTLIEDYGAAAGGFFFDYGMTLLPQGRWEDAKTAFTDCVTASDKAPATAEPLPWVT